MSPTSGGRSVGIVRSWTKGHGICFDAARGVCAVCNVSVCGSLTRAFGSTVSFWNMHVSLVDLACPLFLCAHESVHPPHLYFPPTFFLSTQWFITVFMNPPLVPILNQINPVHTTPYYLRFILILFVVLNRGLPSGLLPTGSPTIILYAFTFIPSHVTCPTHRILLTCSFWVYLVKSPGYALPHYRSFSYLLSLCPSPVYTFSSSTLSQRPCVTFLLNRIQNYRLVYYYCP
jgi:hypothetical protein